MRMLDRGRALVVALGVAGVVAAMGVTASPAGAAPKAARPYDFDGRQRLSRSSDWGTSFTGRLRAAGWWRRGLAKVVGPGPHQVPRPLWIAHLTLNHLHEAGGIRIARDILAHVGAVIKRRLTSNSCSVAANHAPCSGRALSRRALSTLFEAGDRDHGAVVGHSGRPPRPSGGSRDSSSSHVCIALRTFCGSLIFPLITCTNMNT